MNAEQKARFQTILDEYDAAIAAINDADDASVTTIAAATDARRTERAHYDAMTAQFEAVLASAREQAAISKRIMAATRRANDQVRILLNDLAS